MRKEGLIKQILSQRKARQEYNQAMQDYYERLEQYQQRQVMGDALKGMRLHSALRRLSKRR